MEAGFGTETVLISSLVGELFTVVAAQIRLMPEGFPRQKTGSADSSNFQDAIADTKRDGDAARCTTPQTLRRCPATS